MIAAGLERLLDPSRSATSCGRRPRPAHRDKIAAIIELLQVRFRGVFGFMSLFQVHGPPPRREASAERTGSTSWRAVPPDDRLAVPVEMLGSYLRLLAFGSAIPPFNVHVPSTPTSSRARRHGVAVIDARRPAAAHRDQHLRHHRPTACLEQKESSMLGQILVRYLRPYWPLLLGVVVFQVGQSIAVALPADPERRHHRQGRRQGRHRATSSAPAS